VGEREIVGIGSTEAQQEFMKENKRFLEEWPLLQSVIEKVFLNRTIHAPSQEAWERVKDLPDDAPEVMEIEDKYKSDIIVYTLGRIAVDDFSELIVLAANGWGIGALKILRGMYERVVTAAYIAKTPEASRAFSDSFWTHSLKLWKRLSALDPEIEKRATPEVVDTVMSEGKKAEERKKMSVCKQCGQIKTIDAWTPLDLASMAKIAGKYLENLYPLCYLDPTSHMHATGAGVTARMEHTGDAWLYKLDTTTEAQIALHLGHTLLVFNIGIQNDYFNLGLDDLIEPRLHAVTSVWRSEIKVEI
jgi:Family of unknown function (DUF5677)